MTSTSPTIRRLLALALPALLLLAAAAPRDFGYFPGAIVTATPTLTLAPGDRMDRESLPGPGPLTPQIDLRAVRLARQGRHIRFTLTYQIFFAPQSPQTLTVPPVPVGIWHAGRRLMISLPGFPVLISPFRHDLTPVIDPTQIRPDPPDPAPARAAGLGLIGAGLGLIAAGAGLFGWERRRHGTLAAFKAAHRQIRRQKLRGHAALRALHRGFDATAGRPILAADLARFLDQHRRFQPLAAEITQFFAHSNTAFFGAPGPNTPPFDPTTLSRRLARAENRAEPRP